MYMIRYFMYIGHCAECIDTDLQEICKSIYLVEKLEIFWDCDFQRNRVIPHRRPGIIVQVKDTKNIHIIDIAFPNETNIANNVIQNIRNY